MNITGYKPSIKIIFLLAFIFRILSLSGQEVVSDSLKSERLHEIQELVQHDRANALHWWYGWLAGYSAATVGQGIVCFSVDSKATKQDMALGAATTFLGAVGQVVTPIVPGEAYTRNLKNSGVKPDDPQYYEEILKEIARREKAGRSWKMHVVTGVVNIGSGLVTWLGFKRTFRDGVVNFAINTVITEAQIWTQPVRAVKDYQSYSREYNSGSVPVVHKPEEKWFVQAYPGGIAIEFVF